MSPGASVDNVTSGKWVKYRFQVSCPFKRERRPISWPSRVGQPRCQREMLQLSVKRSNHASLGKLIVSFISWQLLPGRRRVYEVSNLAGIPIGGNFFFFSLSPTRPSVAVQTPENNVPL